MRDPFWHATWAAVTPHLRRRDRLLLPPGDWPASSWSMRFYDHDIRIGRANVLILHKGKLGSINKTLLRLIMDRWQFIFANEVFVCFRKPFSLMAKQQEHVDDPHVCTLHEYIDSANLKRVRGTVYFSHIPKAAGTTVWIWLSQRVRSSIYYDTFESFLHNPPKPGEYDLVGGHVPLPLMFARATARDHVVGLIREPTARFRSAFLHSRRPQEDPCTFTPIMRAMRDTALGTFLDTHDGQMEVRQQLLMAGFDFSTEYAVERDAELLRVAKALLMDERCLFRPAEDIDDLVADLARILDIEPAAAPLGRSNSSDLLETERSRVEFEAALPTLLACNSRERELYEFVVARSDSRRSEQARLVG